MLANGLRAVGVADKPKKIVSVPFHPIHYPTT